MALPISELQKLQKELSKAISDNVVQDINVLLKKLKAGVEPTEEVIRATKVGVTVGKLRTHADKKVAEQAKELVKAWKAEVDRQRKSGSAAKDVKKPESSASASPAPSGASPSPTKPKSEKMETNGSPAPAAATKAKVEKREPINFEVTGEKTRNASLKLIHQALEVGSQADPTLIFSRARAVEKAVLDKIGKGNVDQAYRQKMRSLSLNLKDKNNPALRAAVVDGSIAAEKLVFMSAQEMASDARKAETEALQMENLFKAKGAAAQQAETDAFVCGRCKQRKCMYYQMQTRSADEPMTTFVTCTNCGNKWKFC